MQAGKYYIGDLCYVIKDNLWSEVCSKSFEGSNLFEVQSEEIFMGSTSYGDGEYEDSQGLTYGVDSGTIGCIPIDSVLVDKDELTNALKHDLGQMHTINVDFDPEVENGVFHFDNIVINTNPDEEELEEYKEDYYND